MREVGLVRPSDGLPPSSAGRPISSSRTSSGRPLIGWSSPWAARLHRRSIARPTSSGLTFWDGGRRGQAGGESVGNAGQSTELRQRGAESAFAEQPPIEWREGDDADLSSILGEAFGSDRVRISLRNDDGTPAAGIAFRARFRDGHVVKGTLDARGEATIADHTHGEVQVTFPGLPAASWEISSFGGSGG